MEEAPLPETGYILSGAKEVLGKEPNLIELPRYGNVVFVGDTHGDFDGTKRVIDRYMKGRNILVFLGDYVDRGAYSKENIDFLLDVKTKKPERLILLMGNHEVYGEVNPFYTNFWNSLSRKEIELYNETLLELPLAVSGDGFIALHGALPGLKGIDDINKIGKRRKTRNWECIKWGDFRDEGGDKLGYLHGRPQFGRDYFEDVMKRFGKNVLIRSHDTSAKMIMYDKRCLTIFTSHAYAPRRTVAIADLGKETRTTDDLKIEEI